MTAIKSAKMRESVEITPLKATIRRRFLGMFGRVSLDILIKRGPN